MNLSFLSAEWRHLVMLNWEVSADVLQPHVPVGTRLDTWNGTHYVSLVAFLFQKTRLLGIPVPFHRNFEEINLRFYVRREVNGEIRRGVCFLKELVPRRAIAWTARLAYNEPYRAVSMKHHHLPDDRRSLTTQADYEWRDGDRWTRIRCQPAGEWKPLVPNSHEEFIAEHYWGYTRQRDGGTVEYRVAHTPWRIRSGATATVEGDLSVTYGSIFQRLLSTPPASVLYAEGSPIAVHFPSRVA